jgi:hypothetical protein
MTEAIRERLTAAIKASATETWSPWYVLGFVPDEDANRYAEVAIARRRSRSRRQTGRRDPVRDLAKGFRESRKLHPEGEGLVLPGEREDYLA